MKTIFKIFKKIVGLKRHIFLREFYLKYIDNYFVYFYRPSIILKNIILRINNKKKLIKLPLILITQIQRSGGTLCSRLFDGHSELLSYPDELKIATPKWKWKEFNRLYVQYNSIGNFARTKFYSKQDTAIWNKKYKFKFNIDKQRILYNFFSKSNNLNDRHKLNSYFTSFFHSFDNYSHKNKLSKKKFITAFCPRINISKLSTNKFFKIYKDGYLITIIRDPENWFASAKIHAKKYSKINDALKIWEKSTLSSISLKKKFPDRVILIHFNDLVTSPKKVMQKICNFIGIKYEKILNLPTFNSKPILSNSSFKSKEGIIDKETIKRNKIIKLKNNKIFKKYMVIYKNSKKFKL